METTNTTKALEAFKEIVSHNRYNEWINPVLIYSEKYPDEFFAIELDTCLEITGGYPVEIFNISLRYNKIKLYCKIL